MLALPAEASRLAERLFHQWRGVDEHLDVGAAFASQQAGHALEPGFHDVVIVAALGVAGDRPATWICQCRQRIGLWRIVHAQHDDGAGVGPHAERMPAPFGRRRHPGHVAVTALLQELVEPFGDGRADGRRRRHAHRIEARSARLRQHQVFETFVHG